MLNLSKVFSGYGNIVTVRDVSIQFSEGEIVALIGANGAGKSTILMTICGIIPVRSGSIYFRGRPIHGLPPNKIVELGISQVPEGRHIFPQLSVMENLEMGAFLRKDPVEIKKDLHYVFDLFPILEKRKRQDGGTLSGGEQQMLAISRALMAKPKLLLLDEPSLGLAPIVMKQIFDIILKINRDHKTTIFLVEQNANLALQVSHRGYVMEHGGIVLADSSANLVSNNAVKEAYLGV
nr:ABC transporter ATP-binding protein [Desulfobulbaceae bacterium]